MSRNLKIILIGVGILVLVVILFMIFSGGDEGPEPLGETGSSFPITGDRRDTPLGDNLIGEGGQDTSGDNVGDLTGDPVLDSLDSTLVARGPVVSATSYERATTTVVRYLEAGTGHVYDFDTETMSTRKVSNMTIPGIQKVYWGNKGQSAIVQYLDGDEVKNFELRLPPGRASDADENDDVVEGSFISSDIIALAEGPKGNERLACLPYLSQNINRENDSFDRGELRRLQEYLRDFEEYKLVPTGLMSTSTIDAINSYQERYKEEILSPFGLTEATGIVGPSTRSHINERYCEIVGTRATGGSYASLSVDNLGGVLLATSEFDSEVARSIGSMPTSDWLIDWPNSNRLYLQSAPSYKTRGSLYQISTTGSREELLGNVPGLSAKVSPNGEYVAYARQGSVGPSTFIYEVDTGESRPLALTTIPYDKCVWSSEEPSELYCAVPLEITTRHLPDRWYQGATSFLDEIYLIDIETDNIELISSPSLEGLGRLDVTSISLSENEDYLISLSADQVLWLTPLR